MTMSLRRKKSFLNRRDWLKGSATLGAAALLSGCTTSDSNRSRRPASNLIARENLRPGTRDWMLTNIRIDPDTKYRCPWIEGYCSHTSIRAGES